ncbi:MAG: DUF2695 domain-containing protein [Promethearchaeota archaeon]
MKDGRKITLENPRLKIIRKSLRELLDKAFNEEYKKLTNRIIQIKKARRNQKDEKIKVQMNIELKELVDRKNNVDDSYYKSILRCGLCNTIEGDRIYYKKFEKWYCLKCFEANYKHWAPLNWKPRYPLSKEQLLEFFHKLDKLVGSCQTNFDLSKEILTGMDISKSDQKIFLDTLYHYGGHCDCEIMLNAAPNVLSDFDIEEEE